MMSITNIPSLHAGSRPHANATPTVTSDPSLRSPLYTDPFFGREEELKSLTHMLQDVTTPHDIAFGAIDYSLSGTLSDGTQLTDTRLYVWTIYGPIGHVNLIDTGTTTPEPGSIGLLIGMGVSGIGFLARRKNARHSAKDY